MPDEVPTRMSPLGGERSPGTPSTLSPSSHVQHLCSFEGCYKVFSRPSRLEQHYRTHTGERPYSCDFAGCNKSYARSAHLKRHEETAHKERIQACPTIKCEKEDCQKMFCSLDSMRKHVLHFHDRKCYQCHIEGCEATFHKKNQLRRHAQEHKGHKLFQCQVDGCGKQFAQDSHLQRHLKVHEGYTCTEPGCDKKFGKWSLLRKHKAADHKPVYPCGHCDKVLPTKAMHNTHIKVHASDCQVFKCPRENCPRVYAEQRNLNHHIRSYHDGKRFKCDAEGCSRSFSTKQKLHLHEAVHDPTRPLPKKKPRKSKRWHNLAHRLTGYPQEKKAKNEAESETNNIGTSVDKHSLATESGDAVLSSSPVDSANKDEKCVNNTVSQLEHCVLNSKKMIDTSHQTNSVTTSENDRFMDKNAQDSETTVDFSFVEIVGNNCESMETQQTSSITTFENDRLVDKNAEDPENLSIFNTVEITGPGGDTVTASDNSVVDTAAETSQIICGIDAPT